MDNKLKNSVLFSLAQLLDENRDKILEANEADARAFPDMDESMMDRLKVDDQKIDGMIRSLHEVAAQPNPEGRVLHEWVRPDGLRIFNRTVPLGTILIIYESRPDVTLKPVATPLKQATPYC